MTTYETIYCSATFKMRADFAEASSPIHAGDADGNWTSTPYKVIDFAHKPEAAMRQLLIEAERDGGELDDYVEDEIKVAVEGIRVAS